MYTLKGVIVAQLCIVLFSTRHTAAFSINPKVSLAERQQSAGCTRITPTPPAKVCAAVGHLKKPKTLSSPQNYGTYQECRDSCSRRTFFYANGTNKGGCDSFSFSKDTGKCNLYSKSIKAQRFQRDPSDATQFWDIDCFKCPATCPQPLNVNLGENGDFESPQLGPWKNGQYSTGHIVSPGFKSPHAFGCTDKYSCDIVQTIETCRDSFYRISMNIKGTRGSNVGYFSSFGGQSVTGTGEWQYLEAYYQAPHSGAFELDVSINPNNSRDKKAVYYIDNVDVRRVSGSFSTAPGAPELIPNGGFETGKTAPWVAAATRPYAQFDVVRPGINSKHALRYSGAEYDGSLLFQNLLVETGKRYLFRFTSRKSGDISGHPFTVTNSINILLPAHRLRAPRLDFALPFYATERNITVLFAFYFGTTTIDNISLKELA